MQNPDVIVVGAGCDDVGPSFLFRLADGHPVGPGRASLVHAGR